MKNIIEDFFKAYCSDDTNVTAVYRNVPKEMMASAVSESGWFSWTPIKGTLDYDDYKKVEQKFNVVFPKSFIEWHKTYFFLSCDCSIIRLPFSDPGKPIGEVIDELNNDMAKELIEMGLYPFGQDGNDGGPFVFDARLEVENNEFPIRFFDTGLNEVSEILFSSFPKLLECLTHFLTSNGPGGYEAIHDFFAIDPEGAGKTGVDYWLELANAMKWEYEQED
ncbi:SMI1/KNR4 family protein [Pedobacter hiemivivus]|uniref:SMI1/KNR4 family protein n=1 Tax=Pedobacter hiemivivus TaxID=2530454 RepID=A0A4U1GLL1_9SPHI|nr:SMI1/KNR4 family protein [Pedobacter hiemivivus]TKC62482.1 SMI1/KNR4 family protein [Pedobacter hiemivivus]